MYTYKLTFNDGSRAKTTVENLTAAHTKIVAHIEAKGLENCIIDCPNGVVRRVRKTGAHHHTHNGYSFD